MSGQVDEVDDVPCKVGEVVLLVGQADRAHDGRWITAQRDAKTDDDEAPGSSDPR